MWFNQFTAPNLNYILKQDLTLNFKLLAQSQTYQFICTLNPHIPRGKVAIVGIKEKFGR